jgi:hypothetical protein
MGTVLMRSKNHNHFHLLFGSNHKHLLWYEKWFKPNFWRGKYFKIKNYENIPFHFHHLQSFLHKFRRWNLIWQHWVNSRRVTTVSLASNSLILKLRLRPDPSTPHTQYHCTSIHHNLHVNYKRGAIILRLLGRTDRKGSWDLLLGHLHCKNFTGAHSYKQHSISTISLSYIKILYVYSSPSQLASGLVDTWS